MKLTALLFSLLWCVTTAAAQESFELKPIARGFEDAVAIASAPSEPSKLFVVERRGAVAIVENGGRAKRDLLDISAILSPDENAGLSSVAFPPHYAQTNEIYVTYTDKQGDTIVGRFPTKSGRTVDEDELIVALKVVQPYPHAHRSTIAFAPDNTLYIGLGDSPRKSGASSLAQNPRSLFGKILRISVADPSRYTIPDDNPFAKGSNGAAEVWALGFQNPTSLSFDPATKRVIAIDSGRETQELNLIERAKNYGWNVAEGSVCVAATCDMTGFSPPVYSYEAAARGTAIGGSFYKGSSFPSLQGAYLFADSHSKTIFKMTQRGSTWTTTEIGRASFPIAALGQGAKGEIYVATSDGTLSVLEAGS
jgi:glucose/arabinose dehydrogenase